MLSTFASTSLHAATVKERFYKVAAERDILNSTTDSAMAEDPGNPTLIDEEIAAQLVRPTPRALRPAWPRRRSPKGGDHALLWRDEKTGKRLSERGRRVRGPRDTPPATRPPRATSSTSRSPPSAFALELANALRLPCCSMTVSTSAARATLFLTRPPLLPLSQEFFKKIKFKYLEQEAKSEFLKQVLVDDPQTVSAGQIEALGALLSLALSL